MTADLLLDASGLRAVYRSRSGAPTSRAVDDVSLTVRQGEVLGIAGESGCGKSTLAAVLSQTARPPLYPLAGELAVDGERVDIGAGDVPPRSWRGRTVSLLPQGAMNSLSPTLRIGRFAVDIVRAHEPRTSKQAALDRAAERLSQLALPRRVLDNYPHQLSGGMKQRVITALSTLLNPSLLIVDEPTSALDVSTQRVLIEMLRALLDGQLVHGIIFVTHDLPVLRTIADRIAIMYAGQIIETGRTADMIERARHPYTGALLRSVLVPEPQIRTRRIVGISGAPPDLTRPPTGCRFHPRCSLATDVCSATQPPVGSDDSHTVACWWSARHPGQAVEDQL